MWFSHILRRIYLQVRRAFQLQVENEICSLDEWLQQLNSWMNIEKQLREKLFWFLESALILSRWRDDTRSALLMIQLPPKLCPIRHNHLRVERESLCMFQKLCWIEFKQDWVKWIALAMLAYIMKHLNWILAYWITVMIGEINYIKQKQADVSMTADFEIEVIEIV